MTEEPSATLKFFAVAFGFIRRVYRGAGSMNTSFEIIIYAMNNTYLQGKPDI